MSDFTVISDLAICCDCAALAHGFSAHERGLPYPQSVLDAPARVANDNHVAPHQVEVIVISAHEHEPHFSWSRCDLCLTSLGGDRFDAEILITTRELISAGF